MTKGTTGILIEVLYQGNVEERHHVKSRGLKNLKQNEALYLAAPEMLQTLELIKYHVKSGDENLSDVLLQKIDKAIAKAKGK